MIKNLFIVHLHGFTRAKCGAKVGIFFHPDKYFLYFRFIIRLLCYEEMVLPAGLADGFGRMCSAVVHSCMA